MNLNLLFYVWIVKCEISVKDNSINRHHRDVKLLSQSSPTPNRTRTPARETSDKRWGNMLSRDCKEWTGWTPAIAGSEAEYLAWVTNCMESGLRSSGDPVVCDKCKAVFAYDCGDGAKLCELNFLVTEKSKKKRVQIFQCVPDACDEGDKLVWKDGLLRDLEYNAFPDKPKLSDPQWGDCTAERPKTHTDEKDCDLVPSKKCNSGLREMDLNSDLKTAEIAYEQDLQNSKQRRYQNNHEKIVARFGYAGATAFEQACFSHSRVSQFCLSSVQFTATDLEDKDELYNLTRFKCLPAVCNDPRDRYLIDVQDAVKRTGDAFENPRFVQVYSQCTRIPSNDDSAWFVSDKCAAQEERSPKLEKMDSDYRSNMFQCYSDGLNERQSSVHKDCNTHLDIYRTVCEQDQGRICNVRLKFKENTGIAGLGIQDFEFESYQCVMDECNNAHDLKTMEWQQIWIFEAAFGPEDNSVTVQINCDGHKSPSTGNGPDKPPKAASSLGRKALIFVLILFLVIGFMAAIFMIWKRNNVISQETDQTSLLPSETSTHQEEGKSGYRIYTRLDS